MAVTVPAGSSRIDVLYRNSYEVTSSTIKIVVALLAIALIFIWGTPGIAPLSLALVLALFVWKNSFSLPGIKNDEIPERPLRTENIAPNTTGLQRMEAKEKSEPIFAGNVYRTQFISPLNGLKSIALQVFTPEKTVNDYELKIVVRQVGSDRVIERNISSKGFNGYRWFDLSFNEFSFSRDAVFEIEVSAENATAENAPSMILEDESRLAIITYHNPLTAYQ